MRDDIHDGHSWYFSNATLEVLIAGGHDVAPMLPHTLHETVISIGPLVVALQSLEPRVFGDPQGQTVLDAELLQLSDHAIGDVGDALAEEAVHAGLEDVQLVLDGEVDEVGVDEDAVGRTEGVVVREEEAGGLLGTAWERRYS
jgi:hypothetical protein